MNDKILYEIINTRISALKDLIIKKETEYRLFVQELCENNYLRKIHSNKIKGIVKTIEKLEDKIRLLQDILKEGEFLSDKRHN